MIVLTPAMVAVELGCYSWAARLWVSWVFKRRWVCAITCDLVRSGRDWQM
jgi:hypothetical protein